MKTKTSSRVPAARRAVVVRPPHLLQLVHVHLLHVHLLLHVHVLLRVHVVRVRGGVRRGHFVPASPLPAVEARAEIGVERNAVGETCAGRRRRSRRDPARRPGVRARRRDAQGRDARVRPPDPDRDCARGVARVRARRGEILLRHGLAGEETRRVLVEGARGVFALEPEQVVQVVVRGLLRDVLRWAAVLRVRVLGMHVGMEPVPGIAGEIALRTGRARPRRRRHPRRPEPRGRGHVPPPEVRLEPRKPVPPERHLPRLARQRVRGPSRPRVQVRARLARLLRAFLLGHHRPGRRKRGGLGFFFSPNFLRRGRRFLSRRRRRFRLFVFVLDERQKLRRFF
mmetsp:Transcript_3157/g.12687  ORF Transcript_3157/g.12687 Transcript_3157/m.12687 type:complete len:340 (+) Transcript_3157:1213-2232(+)